MPSLSENMSWCSVLGQRIASRHWGSNPSVGEKKIGRAKTAVEEQSQVPAGAK